MRSSDTPPPGYAYAFELVDDRARATPSVHPVPGPSDEDAIHRVLHLRVLSLSNHWLVNRVFDTFPVVLGRDPTCDAPIIGVGQGAQVSRFHARIDRLEDGALQLVDLGSTNGTFVDRRRLVPHVPFVLHGPCVHFYLGPLCVIGWHEPAASLPRDPDQLRPVPPLVGRTSP